MVSYLGKDINFALGNTNEDFNNLLPNSSYNYNMNYLYPFNLMYPPTSNPISFKSKPRKSKDNLVYIPPIDKNDKMKLILPETNKYEIIDWFFYFFNFLNSII